MPSDQDVQSTLPFIKQSLTGLHGLTVARTGFALRALKIVFAQS